MKPRSFLSKTRGNSRPGLGNRRRSETQLQHGGFNVDSKDDDVMDYGDASDPDDKSSVLEKRELVRGSLALAIIILSALSLLVALLIDLYHGTWQAVWYVAAVVIPFVSAVVYHYFKKP
jgi:hypothetical protein